MGISNPDGGLSFFSGLPFHFLQTGNAIQFYSLEFRKIV